MEIMNMIARLAGALLVVFISMSSAAAATTYGANPEDPYENFNRHTFKLNEGLDKAIFKPAATIYNTVLPWPVTRGVHNFFSNLGEIPTVINDLLQVRIYQATSDTWRFLINSTVGVFGLIDVASTIGLEKHYQDLGLTFAIWGYKNSAYLVLPVFGSSTVRDGIAFPINQSYFNIYSSIYPVTVRNSLYGLNMVNMRAQLLEVDRLINQAAFDRYSFERNAWLQRRQHQIESDRTESRDELH